MTVVTHGPRTHLYSPSMADTDDLEPEPQPEEAADEVTVGAWLDQDPPEPLGSVVRDPPPPGESLLTRIKRALGLAR